MMVSVLRRTSVRRTIPAFLGLILPGLAAAQGSELGVQAARSIEVEHAIQAECLGG